MRLAREYDDNSLDVHFTLVRGKFTCTEIRSTDLSWDEVSTVRPPLRPYVLAQDYIVPTVYDLDIWSTRIVLD